MLRALSCALRPALASSSTPRAWLPQRRRSPASAAALGRAPPSMDHTRTERVCARGPPAACGIKTARKGKPVASILRLAAHPDGSCTHPAQAT
jgi:hypothetical protein